MGGAALEIDKDDMRQVFLYGTLCHAPLLEAVLGHAPEMMPAELPGHAVLAVPGAAYPRIVAQPGSRAIGVLIEVGKGDLARLDYYEGGFGYARRQVNVSAEDGSPRPAQVYFPPSDGAAQSGPAWSLHGWAARWGAVTVEAARDVMRNFPDRPAREVMRRYPMILGRAASRLRARADAPATLRRAAAPADVEIEQLRQPYANYFAVEEADLRFRRFDGSMSPAVTRAGFVINDAVTVLPYDPARDRVMVIEQFRAGPHLRGDANSWSLEPIAGRVDGDETPHDAAHREAGEEAGLPLTRLEEIAAYYPSPGAVTEFLYSYLAVAELPDAAKGLGGVASEAEDIRAHVISFDALMDLIVRGEVLNGPLLLSALWLQRERERLRAGA